MTAMQGVHMSYTSHFKKRHQEREVLSRPSCVNIGR